MQVSALPHFDLTSSQFVADPYPSYHAMRAVDPVLYSEALNSWVITGYAACQAMLRDRRLGHEPLPGNPMLFQNPPDHTRLRHLSQDSFLRNRIEKLAPRVQQLTDGLLDCVEGHSGMEIVGELSLPLPAMVIAELFGVPGSEWHKFNEWSVALTVGSYNVNKDPRIEAEANAARKAFDAYCEGLIEERRKHPGDDLLSSLIKAKDDGDRLTELELHMTCMMLLVAGHVTTVNLIASGILALLRHPAQARRLQNDPQLLDSAVEEFLRYDCPFQVVYRMALEDFEWEGHCFHKYDSVAMFLGAANRDPARFERPDDLDIARWPPGHLAFGAGIHFCLGAPLARLEGRIAIGTILRRMPRLALAPQELTYANNYVLRGPVALRVTF